jgi:hypothetical protein
LKPSKIIVVGILSIPVFLLNLAANIAFFVGDGQRKDAALFEKPSVEPIPALNNPPTQTENPS